MFLECFLNILCSFDPAAQVKRGNDRVAVAKNKFHSVSAPAADITGGYLFKIDHVDPTQVNPKTLVNPINQVNANPKLRITLKCR